MLLRDGDNTYEIEFVIVKGKKASLLGLKASILLGLVRGVNKVDKERITHNVEDKYNDIFQGIGKLGP